MKTARLNEYAKLALEQARKASANGSYGVGGVLLDKEGNILCEMQNRVFDGFRYKDPTAHGERQIVDWYFENKERKHLPEPEDCILITSLDPCLMCTGALIQAGFDKVIVIALDHFAGINSRDNYECTALEGTESQKYVVEHFAYPRVTGEESREANGADLSGVNLFNDITISTETLQGCQDAFRQNVSNVRKKRVSTAADADDVQNPAKLDSDHPIRRYLEETFGEDCFGCTWQYGDPASVITEYMDEKHPGFDGVAYFDMFGNLICLAENDPYISSKSALMKVTRKYAAARSTEPIGGYEINDYLCNPQRG